MIAHSDTISEQLLQNQVYLKFDVISLSFYCPFLQAVFLSAIPNTLKRLWEAAVRKLHALWKNNDKVSRHTFTTLVNGDPSLFSLSLLAVVIDFLDKDVDTKDQEKILTLFSKTVLSARSKPLQSIIVNAAPIFKRTTRAQFSNLLLPGTLKCLLRNPDELLEGEPYIYFCLPSVLV